MRHTGNQIRLDFTRGGASLAAVGAALAFALGWGECRLGRH